MSLHGTKRPVDGAPQESVVETLPSVAVIITDLNRELIKTQPQLYEKVISRMPLADWANWTT
jgi:hypothetical protein